MSINKPVKEITVEEMEDYEYAAKITINRTFRQELLVLASNSLNNLKREIRERGFRQAWITAKKGAFSYGQSVVDEYPYRPRK